MPAEPRELKALFDALEANPTDRVTLLALADWYEEQEQQRACGCLRWLAAEGKAPYRYRHDGDLLHHHESWHDGWYWWATRRERRGWGYDRSCVLPHRQWDRVRHSFSYDPLVFKEYPSVRAATEALMAVWAQSLVAQRKRRPS